MVVICARCERVSNGATVPLTWASLTESGHTSYVCERCARENVRSIEAQLDPAWW